ncbi:hypothetical protein GCM10029964_034420 [Kibdelosporangium lantanae]
MKKRIIWVVIGVLAGIGAIFGGISQQHKSDSTVYCGSKMMLPGDICQETKNGSTKDRTYEEQRAANKGEGNLVILGGGVIILISLGSLVVGLVRRKRPPTTTGQPQPPAAQVHVGQWPQPPAPQQPAPPAYLQQPVQQQNPQNWSGQPQTPGPAPAPPHPAPWSGGQQPPSW